MPDTARLAFAIVALALFATSAAGAADLSASERAGRRLYHEGIGASGASVVATVGLDESRVPGHVVPCASCHGADGLGRSEGGVVPPVITWVELSKPYGHLHDNGRRHGPFDAAGLTRAVTLGIDPAGNPLERTMPRYALGRDDLANLFAYLRRLELDTDPGVHADALRLGTLLPAAGPLGDTGRLMQRVLDAYIADLNTAGGLYGRRIELVAPDYGGDRAATLARAKALMAEGDVLALVAPLVAGAEAELVSLAEEQRVPIVGPVGAGGLGVGSAEAATRYTFVLQAGLREQVRTLVAYAAGALALEGAPLTLVASAEPAYEPLAAALAAQCVRARCGRIAQQRYSAGGFDAGAAVAAHQASGARLLFFLGPEADLAALLRAAAERGVYPTVLLPGALGARAAVQAPAGFDGRLLLAYPSAPRAALASGGPFEAFRARHGLPTGQVAAQAAAYAAAALLGEGLRRSGRAVSREKLVAALESVRGLDTDAVPTLTYGPDRRIGAFGGVVVALDTAGRSFRPVSPWLPLE